MIGLTSNLYVTSILKLLLQTYRYLQASQMNNRINIHERTHSGDPALDALAHQTLPTFVYIVLLVYEARFGGLSDIKCFVYSSVAIKAVNNG